MKRILFIIIFVFFSCGQPQTPSIFLGNGAVFKVLPQERIAPITKELQAQYQTMIMPYQQSEMPAYKVITTDNYTLYIGILLRLQNLEEFVNLYPNLGFKIQQGQYAYRVYQASNGDYVTESVVQSNDNYYYIATKTSNQEVHTSVFSEEELSKRIEKKE